MLCRASEGYAHIGDKSSLNECFSKCDKYLSIISNLTKAHYYGVYLTHNRSSLTKENVYDVINKYLNIVPTEEVNWIILSNAYLSVGDISSAKTSLNNYNKNNTDNTKYYAMLTQIYKEEGAYKNALDAYELHNRITDSLDFVALEQDTHFVEERHQLELATLKEEAGNRSIHNDYFNSLRCCNMD